MPLMAAVAANSTDAVAKDLEIFSSITWILGALAKQRPLAAQCGIRKFTPAQPSWQGWGTGVFLGGRLRELEAGVDSGQMAVIGGVAVFVRLESEQEFTAFTRQFLILNRCEASWRDQ